MTQAVFDNHPFFFLGPCSRSVSVRCRHRTKFNNLHSLAKTAGFQLGDFFVCPLWCTQWRLSEAPSCWPPHHPRSPAPCSRRPIQVPSLSSSHHCQVHTGRHVAACSAAMLVCQVEAAPHSAAWDLHGPCNAEVIRNKKHHKDECAKALVITAAARSLLRAENLQVPCTIPAAAHISVMHHLDHLEKTAIMPCTSLFFL